jgi:hypothetical protein
MRVGSTKKYFSYLNADSTKLDIFDPAANTVSSINHLKGIKETVSLNQGISRPCPFKYTHQDISDSLLDERLEGGEAGHARTQDQHLTADNQTWATTGQIYPHKKSAKFLLRLIRNTNKLIQWSVVI